MSPKLCCLCKCLICTATWELAATTALWRWEAERRVKQGTRAWVFELISQCSLWHPTRRGYHNLSATWKKQPKEANVTAGRAKKSHQTGSPQSEIWCWVLAKCSHNVSPRSLISPNALRIFRPDTWTLITTWLPWEKEVISFCFHPSHSRQQWEAARWLIECSKRSIWVPFEDDCHTPSSSENLNGIISEWMEPAIPQNGASSQSAPERRGRHTLTWTERAGVPLPFLQPVTWWSPQKPTAILKSMNAKSQSRSPNKKSPNFEKKLTLSYSLTPNGMLSWIWHQINRIHLHP